MFVFQENEPHRETVLQFTQDVVGK